MYRIEEVYGSDRCVYLALRPELPPLPRQIDDDEEAQGSHVVIIDMFDVEEENVYEF